MVLHKSKRSKDRKLKSQIFFFLSLLLCSSYGFDARAFDICHLNISRSNWSACSDLLSFSDLWPTNNSFFFSFHSFLPFQFYVSFPATAWIYPNKIDQYDDESGHHSQILLWIQFRLEIRFYHVDIFLGYFILCMWNAIMKLSELSKVLIAISIWNYVKEVIMFFIEFDKYINIRIAFRFRFRTFSMLRALNVILIIW